MGLVNAFWAVLGFEPCSTGLLQGECSRFNWFQEQKTEAPVKLTIYMFTTHLLYYIQYPLQYLHIAVVPFMYSMLYLTTQTKL